VTLSLENPLNNLRSEKTKVIEYIDTAITGVFVAEAVAKIISFGFLLNGEFSYLKKFLEHWRLCDSELSSFFTEYSLFLNLKVFRIVRL